MADFIRHGRTVDNNTVRCLFHWNQPDCFDGILHLLPSKTIRCNFSNLRIVIAAPPMADGGLVYLEAKPVSV